MLPFLISCEPLEHSPQTQNRTQSQGLTTMLITEVWWQETWLLLLKKSSRARAKASERRLRKVKEMVTVWHGQKMRTRRRLQFPPEKALIKLTLRWRELLVSFLKLSLTQDVVNFCPLLAKTAIWLRSNNTVHVGHIGSHQNETASVYFGSLLFFYRVMSHPQTTTYWRFHCWLQTLFTFGWWCLFCCKWLPLWFCRENHWICCLYSMSPHQSGHIYSFWVHAALLKRFHQFPAFCISRQRGGGRGGGGDKLWVSEDCIEKFEEVENEELKGWGFRVGLQGALDSCCSACPACHSKLIFWDSSIP